MGYAPQVMREDREMFVFIFMCVSYLISYKIYTNLSLNLYNSHVNLTNSMVDLK